MSFGNISKSLIGFTEEKRNYVPVWNLKQRFGSLQIIKRKRISAFIIDETVIQIDNQHFW
ncbi:MAG: hypothetical protein MRJ93_02325 [Nitrososphaeraceae archaeon]|nr:hypothetical protein [Nitrososphaeraceae archaeon]